MGDGGTSDQFTDFMIDKLNDAVEVRGARLVASNATYAEKIE